MEESADMESIRDRLTRNRESPLRRARTRNYFKSGDGIVLSMLEFDALMAERDAIAQERDRMSRQIKELGPILEAMRGTRAAPHSGLLWADRIERALDAMEKEG